MKKIRFGNPGAPKTKKVTNHRVLHYQGANLESTQDGLSRFPETLVEEMACRMALHVICKTTRKSSPTHDDTSSSPVLLRTRCSTGAK